MRLVYILSVIAVLSCFGCAEESDKVVAKFEDLNDRMKVRDYQYILDHSTAASQQLVHDLTQPQNIQLDSLIRICSDHRIGELCVLYQKQVGDYMKKQGDETDFLAYLGHRQLPWFSIRDSFEHIPGKVRLGNLNHLAIYRTLDGDKRASWIQFRKDDSGEYSFDLIASLQYENQHIRKTLPKELTSIRDVRERLKALAENSIAVEKISLPEK